MPIPKPAEAAEPLKAPPKLMRTRSLRAFAEPTESAARPSWKPTPAARRPLLPAPAPAMAICIEAAVIAPRSEEHTSELQSLMRISYAVFCLKKKKLHLTTTMHRSRTTRRIRHLRPLRQHHNSHIYIIQI